MVGDCTLLSPFSVLWGVLSAIGFLIIGLFVFEESLSPVQMIAVGLGIVSLFILTVFE